MGRRTPDYSNDGRRTRCLGVCHNRKMTKIFKWLFFTALALMALLLMAIFGLHRWINTDAFRQRMERDASAALGVPVAVDSIQVDVWPLPAVALGNLRLQSTPPVTLERLEVRPDWRALLQGQLVVSTLIVRKAVLPQQGIDAVLLAMQKKKPVASAIASSTAANAPAVTAQPVQAPKTAPAPAAITVANAAVTSDGQPPTDAVQWLPRRTVFDDVTWVSNAGTSTAIEGETRLGPDALPDTVLLKIIRGNLQGLRAELKREPHVAGSTAGSATQADQWALQVNVGGGKIDGKLGLHRGAASGDASGLAVQGNLETRGVEVSALTAPNKPLTGLIDASTTLQSRAATTAALIDALQTQTSFTVRDATLNGIDLAKAIKSAGTDRSGQTRLQTLTGQVSSQGRALQLSNLIASSGVLSATGNVTVSPLKVLAGNLSVNLANDSKLGSALGGGVSVPLVVGGTVEKPDVSVSRAGLLGAALGTGAGARLGDKLGEKLGGLKGLFGK
jgi:hypothetical protein